MSIFGLLVNYCSQFSKESLDFLLFSINYWTVEDKFEALINVGNLADLKQISLAFEVTLASIVSSKNFMDEEHKQIFGPRADCAFEKLFSSLAVKIKQNQCKLLKTCFLNHKIRTCTHKNRLYIHDIKAWGIIILINCFQF